MTEQSVTKRPCPGCGDKESVADIAARYGYSLDKPDDAIGDLLADFWFCALVAAISIAAVLCAVAIAVRL